MNPPTRTLRAYKLFQRKRGLLFPLFIGRSKPTPVGVWTPAEFLPTPGFAPRPGWHVGTAPRAPHLMCRDGTMPENRVWAEVEVPADRDWTPEAQAQPTGDLRGQIPEGGFYRFKRPANQGGEWIIAGAIRVLRVLERETEHDDAPTTDCATTSADGQARGY